MEIDTAKDIYRNATLEKVALLRILFAHKQRDEDNLRIWDDRLLVRLPVLLLHPSLYNGTNMIQEMKDVLGEMRSSSANLDITSNAIGGRLDGAFTPVRGAH